MNEFTHFDKNGNAIMVDVSDKNITDRTAIATGTITVSDDVISSIKNNTNKKGDVLSVATVAGIMGSKRTSDIIPMCHNIPITSSKVHFSIEGNVITATSTLKTCGKTGIEMEALSSVSIALLTIYDMCKAIDKHMVISNIKLVSKTGGKSDFSL